MDNRRILVLDTTLRDGEQAPGCSMRTEEKLEIARQLERLGVDVIEAGFPIASRDDFAAVREIAKTVRSSTVTGLCRAVAGDISSTWEAVRHSESPMIHIFLATSDIHLEYKLQVTRERLLEIAAEAVAYARSLCPQVLFTAEDATRSDRAFLMEVFSTVEKAGATAVNIADTVGYAAPEEMAELVRLAKGRLSPETGLGVHCHNDLGMGTANTLSAIKAGATQFDCTIAGIGERAGMAALEEVVMSLRTRAEFYGADTRVKTGEFNRAGKLLANSIDLTLAPHKAILGENAFAHEAGVHQHGIMANPLTYEIMKPEDVGVFVNRIVMGKHSGKAALRERLEQLGYRLDHTQLETVFQRFKTLTDNRKVVNDADIEALVKGEVKLHQPYSLVDFVVNSGTCLTATAVVKLAHKGKVHEHVARGETAVIAAFNAVDKIIKHTFPLHNFSIQSISGGRTELGESTVCIVAGEKVITGRGLDTDIVEACIKAYLSAINQALAEQPE